MSESTAQLLARLIHTGGRILIVGGEIKDLPRTYHEHPAILLWDDNVQEFSRREVPSNVKAILWNRWCSHDTARKLNDAAVRLRALKFPMLRTREIKEMMSEIVQQDVPVDVSPAQVQTELEKALEREQKSEEREETEMAKKGRVAEGELQKFIARHMKVDVDYSVRGSIAREGERLFEKAKGENFETTLASMRQAVGRAVRGMGKRTVARPKRTPSTVSSAQQKSMDDFEELDHLIQDAIAAMRLVQEHLPKVRKETERLRGVRDKMRKLLGE